MCIAYLQPPKLRGFMLFMRVHYYIQRITSRFTERPVPLDGDRPLSPTLCSSVLFFLVELKCQSAYRGQGDKDYLCNKSGDKKEKQ